MLLGPNTAVTPAVQTDIGPALLFWTGSYPIGVHRSDDFCIANLCLGTKHIEHIGGVYTVIYGKLWKIDVGLMLWTSM